MEKEMAPATFKDEGSIDYSWYVSEDGKEVNWRTIGDVVWNMDESLCQVHIYERYKDVDACLQHSATFAPFGARFMACGDFAGFYVMVGSRREGDELAGTDGLSPTLAEFDGYLIIWIKIDASCRSFSMIPVAFARNSLRRWSRSAITGRHPQRRRWRRSPCRSRGSGCQVPSQVWKRRIFQVEWWLNWRSEKSCRDCGDEEVDAVDPWIVVAAILEP